jgi:hypothetical protein
LKPVGTVGTAAAGAAELGAVEAGALAGALAGADELAGVVADGAGGTGVALLEQAPTSTMTAANADVLRSLVVMNTSSLEQL